jgi:antitoxin (DNA-binding transcriptional repressor) of toxin-antitoxin stability system
LSVDHPALRGTRENKAGRQNLSNLLQSSQMSSVSLAELQRDGAALLDRVEAGEHLVVLRGGRPVAELRPFAASRSSPRPFGLCAGEFTVPDDFDAPLPDDILRKFEGR